MKIQFTSLRPIVDLLEKEGILSPREISEKLSLGRTITHKYLKELLEKKKIEKIGHAPNTKYDLAKGENNIHVTRSTTGGWEVKKPINVIDFRNRKKIDEIFLKFSPTGELLNGSKGFQKWCTERNLVIEKKIKDYIKIYNYIESQQDICGMLSADEAFGKDFQEMFLDRVYYADQYKYMDFGRGKLAELTFYAKQSQNKGLIAESIAEIMPKLECNIYREKYDAIAITPWSIKRQNQLLGALKKELEVFQLPFVKIIKYSQSQIFIPQKSLKSRKERIENAKNTIFIDDAYIGNYKKVLLIDDFVGSGATLNETAKKLKDEGVELVTGFAFVGNTNLSYDIINEI